LNFVGLAEGFANLAYFSKICGQLVVLVAYTAQAGSIYSSWNTRTTMMS